MNPTHSPRPIPPRPFLTAISEPTRWRILQELLHSEPLPASEIARRLGIPATNISKHCAVLKRAGIIQRGFGDLYKIPPDTITQNGTALELGPVVLRLAVLKTPPSPTAPPSPSAPAH